ncbi:stalk domain-containing protein [Cohnella suwonensis]|uniref:Stalk domain-containing protein n=1 Tax=Cohnella suwonensis TaxID=696072 RepID=A0ABW0LZZ9_9BACL
MKRISFLACGTLLACAIGGTASAATAATPTATVTATPATAVKAPIPIKVSVNGKPVEFGDGLFVDRGKAYVDYEALFEALGYETRYDATTKTIRANTEDAVVAVPVGGEQAFANGGLLASAGESIERNGRAMVGVRFAGKLTNFGVEWDGKTKTISLVYQGPTAEQKAAVYDVFNRLQLLEAAADGNGLVALFAEDASIDREQVKKTWSSAKTKTTYEAKYLESYSDTVAIVALIENTTKISGGFFPDNRSETRYTLHKAKDGSWKIYDVEVSYVQYTNLPGLFKQTADVPEAEKATIGAAFENQVKAFNAKDADGYIATLSEVADKDALKASLTELFQNGSIKATVEQWAVVEYDGSSHAKLLVSLLSESDIGGVQSSTRSILLNGVVKVEGKWLLDVDAVVLTDENL